MYLLVPDTKPFCRKVIFLLFSFSFSCSIAGNAQSTGRLPDSVNAEEDTVAYSANDDADSSQTSNKAPADSIVLRAVPDTVVAALKKDRAFAYANDAAYWTKQAVVHRKNFWDYFWEWVTGKTARIFFYSILIAVLLFAFYKIIVDNKLYLFYSKPKKLADHAAEENDVSDENIDESINRAFAAQDYRTAVRFMHLKALRLLDKHQLIRFQAQATNYEYALQLTHPARRREFQFLSDVYEHVWYGGFLLNREQAEMLHQHFNRFYLNIGI